MFELLVVLLAFAAYSLFSKRLGRTVLTLPILFTGLGLVLSAPLQVAVARLLGYRWPDLAAVLGEGGPCARR